VKTKDGNTVKSLLNGKYYKVKRIVKSMAVLRSEDGQSQILTELQNLNLWRLNKILAGHGHFGSTDHCRVVLKSRRSHLFKKVNFILAR